MTNGSNLATKMETRWKSYLSFIGTAVLAAVGISFLVSGGSTLVKTPAVPSVLIGVAILIVAGILSLSYLPRPEYTRALFLNLEHPIKKTELGAQFLTRQYVWPITYMFFLIKAYTIVCNKEDEPDFVEGTLKKMGTTGFFKSSPGGEPRSDSNVITAPLRDYLYDVMDLILVGWLAWWHTSELYPIRSLRDLPADKRKNLLATVNPASLPASLTKTNPFLDPFPDLGEAITVPKNCKINYERSPYPTLTLESNKVKISLTMRLLRYGIGNKTIEGRFEILVRASGKFRSFLAQEELHMADEFLATLGPFLEVE